MTARRRAGSLLVALLCAIVLDLTVAAPASAHPLGNFTVNRYARIELSGDLARVLYVLDLAEIPSFQAREALDADAGRYAEDQVAEIASGIVLEVDGGPVDLRPVEHQLTRPDGQGGLFTTRLVVLFEAQLPEAGPDAVRDGRFRDDNGGQRIGWREIVVSAPGTGEILTSTAPHTDITDELRGYPQDRLRSPLDVREATFRFTAGTQAAARPSLTGDGGAGPRSDRLTDLLDRQDLTPWVLAGMLAVAALVGVGHALAPGHGKTVMAAYLIGTQGRPVDAVLLGVIVSAMHTVSVLLLGLGLYQVDERFALDRIYPVLTLVSGIGVLIVGAWLATTRARALQRRSVLDDERRDDAVDGHLLEPRHFHGVAFDRATPPVVVSVGGATRTAVGAGDDAHRLALHHGDHDHHHDDDHDDDARDRHGHAAGDGHGHDDHGHEEHGHGHAAGDGHGHDDHGHEEHGHGHAAGDGHGDHGHEEHGHRHAAGDGHGHDDHGHEEHRRWGRRHHHGPGGHSHDLPEGVAPLSRRGLVLLATAGGVIPSPSAVVVLVSAFTLGRVGLGLALVAAFSIGLAVTLTAVGLALVLGSRAMGGRLSDRLARVFPVIGAAALLVVGLVLTIQGVRGV